MVSPDVPTAPPERGEERLLVAQVVAGDRGAARALYDAHVTRVHRLAFRMCGDAELARDLTQDIFVRVFRQLATFRGESAFGTWVHRVAVSVILNAMEKIKTLRNRETSFDEAHDQAIDDPALNGDPHVRARLSAALATLPDHLRLALVMHAIEGFTHAQIAAAFGIAEGTSKTRVFDARARLRLLLADLATD